jgi:nucleoside 2-deoxyribosyltransferase
MGRTFLSAQLAGFVLLTALPAFAQSETRVAGTKGRPSASPVKVYLASPLGFADSTRMFMYKQLIPKLTSVGVNIEDPWDAPRELDEQINNAKRITDLDTRRKAWTQIVRQLGERNARLIRDAQGVVAVLDGVDIDSGTAAEIGYAAALGKWVIGYRGDFRRTGEDVGSEVNLQVEYFILRSGGEVVHSLDDLQTALRKRIER